MDSTPMASAMLRRISIEPSGYLMEVGLLNKSRIDLTSWQATIALPEGANMTARDGAAITGQTASRVYTVRPESAGPLVPGQRQIITVEVHGTTQAPTSAQFTVAGTDGTTVKAPVTLMAAAVADESTWPGSTTVDADASGTRADVHTNTPAAVGTDWGGGGGGGGGGGQTKFRVNFEWETSTNAGGGGGGGPQLPNLPNAQGAQNDWQQYQPQNQQFQTDPGDGIKAEVHALSERVAKLEGKGA